MKLEVGMYVRTERGNIFKVNSLTIIDKDGIYFKSLIRANGVIQDIPSLGYLDHENGEMITKASHNIIDLIEVGDIIVNTNVYRDKESNIWDVKYIRNSVELDMLKTYVFHNKRVIKQILPREQWTSKVIKVGE